MRQRVVGGQVDSTDGHARSRTSRPRLVGRPVALTPQQRARWYPDLDYYAAHYHDEPDYTLHTVHLSMRCIVSWRTAIGNTRHDLT